MTNLPNFFIIGAPRSATTSVHEWLLQHPDFFMSGMKEPSYFAYEDGAAHEELPWPDPFPRVWNDYIALFQDAGERAVVGESSTLYLQTPEAAHRLEKRLPGSKMVVLLRDPADRAFSHFALHRSTDSEPIASFREALDLWPERRTKGWRPHWDYIEPGFYAKHLDHWQRVVGSERLKVFLFEDIRRDPQTVLREICRFTGASDSFEFAIAGAHNAAHIPKPGIAGAVYSTMRRLAGAAQIIPHAIRTPVANRIRKSVVDEHQKLTPEDRRYLIEIYREDIERLEGMIGSDLTRWKRVEK